MNIRALILGILVLLCLLGGLLMGFFFRDERAKGAERSVVTTEVQETQGQPHHGWTPFYFAKTGTWKMLDDATYVLREQKFTSSDRERDAYTVFKVGKGGIVRTIASEGRWKQVEVLKFDVVVATGWVDAHFITNVEEIAEAAQVDSVEDNAQN